MLFMYQIVGIGTHRNNAWKLKWLYIAVNIGAIKRVLNQSSATCILQTFLSLFFCLILYCRFQLQHIWHNFFIDYVICIKYVMYVIIFYFSLGTTLFMYDRIFYRLKMESHWKFSRCSWSTSPSSHHLPLWLLPRSSRCWPYALRCAPRGGGRGWAATAVSRPCRSLTIDSYILVMVYNYSMGVHHFL
jgi:hypothetical protein